MSATTTPPSPLTRVQHLLYLLCYHVLHFLFTLETLLRSLLDSLRPRRTPSTHLPPHVALSGALAAHPAALSHLISLLCSHGVYHISLHDPWTAINAPLVQALLRKRHPTLSITLREIHADGSHATYPSLTQSNAPSANLPVLSLIHPHAGRAALVAAARRLTRDDAWKMSVEEVVCWLDRQDGMLPSEPDVVVVFPPRASRGANVLHGFPPWQLRLTQIRFATRDVGQLDDDELLRMVSSAAAAPKRFGR